MSITVPLLSQGTDQPTAGACPRSRRVPQERPQPEPHPGVPAGLRLLHPAHLRAVGSATPRALMSDAEAVEELVNHRYFQPHITPVQVFNRATDPFLPNVRPHTFAVLEDLDARESAQPRLGHHAAPDEARRRRPAQPCSSTSR